MDGIRGRLSPPTLRLRVFIDDHRGALEYEWRARFGLPLTVVGTPEMTWGEATRLVEVITQDPASPLTAAVSGWDYPLSREAMALVDLFDLTVTAHAGRRAKDIKPYPRPWPDPTVKSFGRPAPSMTPEDIHAALARFGKPTNP